MYFVNKSKEAARCLSTAAFFLPDSPGVFLHLQKHLLLLLVSLLQHVLVVLTVRPQQLVPPGEGGGVVPNKVHVVEVVETGASIERDQVEWVQRDVVTTVDIDGL